MMVATAPYHSDGDLEGWSFLDLGPEGPHTNLKRAFQVNRDSCLSSADGTRKYCFPWQRCGSKQWRCKKKKDPCPHLGWENYVPAPFFPCFRAPNPHLTQIQPPSASSLHLSPVSPQHRPPALFHPSTFCKPQASGEPRKFGEEAMRRTGNHPMQDKPWDAPRTPVLCLQPYQAIPVSAATPRKTVSCKPPGQMPAPFPLKARLGMRIFSKGRRQASYRDSLSSILKKILLSLCTYPRKVATSVLQTQDQDERKKALTRLFTSAGFLELINEPSWYPATGIDGRGFPACYTWATGEGEFRYMITLLPTSLSQKRGKRKATRSHTSTTGSPSIISSPCQEQWKGTIPAGWYLGLTPRSRVLEHPVPHL